MIRLALVAILLLYKPSIANADALIQALNERGFLPAPTLYLSKFTYDPSSSGAGFLFGSGYRVRLPEPIQIQQVLAVSAGRSVILDVVEELGTFDVSPAAVKALELASDGSNIKHSTINIIALMRSTDRLHSTTSPAPEASRPVTALKDVPVPVAAPRTTSEDALTGTIIPFEVAPEDQKPTATLQWTTSKMPVAPSVEANSDSVQDSALDLTRQTAQPDFTKVSLPKPRPSNRSQPNSILRRATTSVAKRLALQVGYFANEQNAVRLADKLNAQELMAQVLARLTDDGQPRWQVIAGPFANQAELEQARSQGGGLMEEAYSIVMPVK